MFDRTFVKREAKKILRDNFLVAILMCLITMILVGDIKDNYKFNISVDMSNKYTQAEKERGNPLLKKGYIINFDNGVTDKDFIYSQNEDYVNSPFFTRFNEGFLILFPASIFIVLAFIRLIISIAMLPVKVGQNRAFLDVYRTGENLDIKNLFYYFKNGNYGNITVNLILKYIVIFLFSLLLIIPGIYKSYQYYFIDYILSDDPTLKFKEAKEISIKMTDGIKWDLFIFEISFVGWAFLSIIVFGLGFFILVPYIEASRARLYLEVKENYIKLEA